jgi:peptidoglycan hydrolase-like protein with peptidoglycan-binding domain
MQRSFDGTFSASSRKKKMMLQRGSKGPAVVQLQEKLNELGFNVGDADGDFGPATESALMDFQNSKGLTADGIAGPNTLDALGLDLASDGNGDSGFSIDDVTPQLVLQMFPFTPIGNIQANLPIVLQALKDADLADKDMVLMALGTIRAETGRFEPISEGISKFNTSPGGHPFDLYDDRADLGNRGEPDGAAFKGRGFVQLTGRANYQKFSRELGLGDDLVNNPDLANDPDIAAKLLAAFLKDKEDGIRQALNADDLKTARKLVNGGSHGLQDFTDAFEKGVVLLS